MSNQEETVYDAIFISDVHLGFKHSKSKALYNFLNARRCRALYLVGDILDLWKFPDKWRWKKYNWQVIYRILQMMYEENTKVYYIIGNHENSETSVLLHSKFEPINIGRYYKYTDPTGKRFLVFHGDCIDKIISKKSNKHTNVLADQIYDYIVTTSNIINKSFNYIGLSGPNFSGMVKRNFKKVIAHISSFEEAAVLKATVNNCDAAITGHIHSPVIKDKYLNCGSFINGEQASALLCNAAGEWELYYEACKGD
jgi:UDP-2,3-diacylglucosamine pyrophosphatase LpxH